MWFHLSWKITMDAPIKHRSEGEMSQHAKKHTSNESRASTRIESLGTYFRNTFLENLFQE